MKFIITVLVSMCCLTAYSLPLVCIDESRHEEKLNPFIDEVPNGFSSAEAYALKLYQRLTGSVIAKSNPRFSRIAELIDNNDRVGAANFITKENNFLKIRIRNFAAPFSSKDASPLEPFNDLQALIIGIVRDELDARLLLTGDIRYSASQTSGLPEPSLKNNEHYSNFESMDLNFTTELEMNSDQWPELKTAAGALTTRAWAKIQYEAGTNRRAVANAFATFLCSPIDGWKMRGAPDMFVRRDVPRNGDGNPATYQNVCRNCHGFMDGLGGAFAKMDFVEGTMTFQENGVVPKMNQNGNVYPPGYVTIDDSWVNLLSHNPSVDFGWRTSMSGQGINEFGHMLANSKAFSRCMVTKAFKEVCAKDVPADSLTALTEGFETSNYNLKKLFVNIVTRNECLSHN